MLGGCNGFLDPSAVGRFNQKPLLVKILSSLDTGVEEVNDEFANATDPRPEDLVADGQDYTLGRNDLITVSITDLVNPGVETVKTTRISETGKISLPYLGQIQAEGVTEAQLEQAIIEAYRNARLVENAQVSVSVSEARSRTFSILGSVLNPGQFGIFQSDFRVLDALVVARDVSAPTGVDYLYVIRREDLNRRATTRPADGAAPTTDPLAPRSQANPVQGNKTVLLQTTGDAGASGTQPPSGDTSGRIMIIDGKSVDIGEGATTTPANDNAQAPGTTGAFAFNTPAELGNTRIIRIPVVELKNGELKYNIIVKPQDMIVVPSPVNGEYYMDGHIARTGAYTLTGRKIDLQMAVAAAGGFDGVAIPARTEIIRRVGEDQKVYARVDLDKISAGLEPDIYLKPNDVVRVGTNVVAPFLASIRSAFRFTYGFGFLYDRNFGPNDNNR